MGMLQLKFIFYEQNLTKLHVTWVSQTGLRIAI